MSFGLKQTRVSRNNALYSDARCKIVSLQKMRKERKKKKRKVKRNRSKKCHVVCRTYNIAYEQRKDICERVKGHSRQNHSK